MEDDLSLSPVYFDDTPMPFFSQWEEKIETVETTAVTEAGTDVVIITRRKKLHVSAGGTFLSQDVDTVESFVSPQNGTFKLILSNGEEHTVRMRDYSKSRKAKSESLSVTAGVWNIKFELIEI